MKPRQLEASGVVKVFGERRVLDDLNLTVGEGEVVAIIGPSGAGKTTLLRCLNLLEIPEAGVIRLRGQTLYQDGRIIAKRLPDVRKRIGMVFQHLHLWPHKTVLGNIIEAPTVTGKLSRAEATERARALLAEVRLLDKTGSYPASLSGGEQQRVAICRTLIMEPEVILLDEITSALDPELVGDVLEVIAGVAERGHTMVVVTHEIVFARDVADRILFLDRGQFVEEGPPERILTEPRHPRTREFLARVLYSKQMRAHL